MEQSDIYNQINLTVSFMNAQNVPAYTGSGSSQPQQGLNSVYSTSINAFLCPSSPGLAPVQLLQRQLVRQRQRQRRPISRPA